MGEALSIESLVKRDRAFVLAGIVGITGMAWGYMAVQARAMYHTGTCSCAGMMMSGPDVNSWSPGALFALFLMWAEMMIAMMLPSAAPMILTFAMINRKRHEREQPVVPTSIFALGYVVAWTAFSAVAAVAQWVLHAKALLSPMMVSSSAGLGAALLIVAGIFQWTPWKHACLTHCQSPLSFLLTQWRDGKTGAFKMGLKHGLYCAGCCWILMALLFVAGVMNLWWIAAISLLVLVEKFFRNGRHIGQIAGIAFCVWGAWLLIQSARV